MVALDAVCDKVTAANGNHPTLIFERDDVEITKVEIDWSNPDERE